MTISGALTNALSGLRAAGRGAEVVSSNISNALTPGYARRVLSLSASAIGGSGGVRIDGIQRIMDAGLAADKRLAGAAQTHAQGLATFHQRVESFLGTPGDPASFTARLADFEAALVTASSRPDAPERLTMAVTAAKGLVSGLASASNGIQDARTAADRMINTQVQQLNTALQQTVALNRQITAAQAQGGDMSTLLDLRQGVIDSISTLVPLREVARDNGQVALYSTGGAVLLDGTAVTVGFTPSNLVTPYMSIDTGTLSGLTINGTPVRTGSDNGALRGGSLGAQFAIRDEVGVSAQSRIDAVARNLVSRFQDPSVDPTLLAGDAGLFTDSGGSFDPVNERGLASRLQVNAAIDPDQGGAAWRLRDGMNAAMPGFAGDASLLKSIIVALNDARVPESGGFGGGAFSLTGLAAVVTSGIGAARTQAEQELSFASARFSELTERQLADGVDTDAEIQRLLLIEQNYAANARVIQTVDDMMQTLLRL